MTVNYVEKCSSVTKYQINTSTLYASLLHGSLLGAYFPLDVKISFEDAYEYEYKSCFKQHIQLDLDEHSLEFCSNCSNFYLCIKTPKSSYYCTPTWQGCVHAYEIHLVSSSTSCVYSYIRFCFTNE